MNQCRDLNPLHDVINQRDYREKYYDCLMLLGLKYNETWLQLIDQGMEEMDVSKIKYNCEEKHWCLAWRAEKDPGYGVSPRFKSDEQDIKRNFLFNGIDELGSKMFLDYFPEYRCEDGRINENRSVIGKSFGNRPWKTRGEFTGNNIIA